MPLSIPHPAFTRRPLAFSSGPGRPAVRGDRRSLVGYGIWVSSCVPREQRNFCFASKGLVRDKEVVRAVCGNNAKV